MVIENSWFLFLVAAKNASKKAKKDVEAEEEEDYTPSTDSGGEDDTSEEEEEETSETIEKIDSASTKRHADSPKKRLGWFFYFFLKSFFPIEPLLCKKIAILKHFQYCNKTIFFQALCKKNERSPSHYIQWNYTSKEGQEDQERSSKHIYDNGEL